jgi:predicted GNAT family acetyltransferase
VKTEVVDRPEQHRFEIVADGQVAGFADYQLRGEEIMFTHTVIEEAYEGKGLGSVLVRHALDSARERGLAVLPLCPFVRSWIARHPDYLPLVPASARAKYKLPA